MPWLFIILGLIVFISALYGLIAALQARRMFALEAAELGLLALALFMHHTSTAGWMALVVALAIEAARQVSSRRRATAPPGSTPENAPKFPDVDEAPGPPPMARLPEKTEVQLVAPPPAMPLPAPLPPTPPSPPKPAGPPLVSIALLRSAWQPAPEVFLASLRRGGERGAKLTSGARGPSIHVSVNGISLELECLASALPRPQIDEAAAQSWDWPEAATTVTSHAGHVIFTTRAGGGTRASCIRLHCRAQQALAEFAPVIAILWPAAGRLIPAASLSQIIAMDGDFDLAKATCINFRTFPLEGAEAGRFLCDTIGFSALGVADLEVECNGEPSARLTAAIYQSAQQMFESESEINVDGATIEHDGESWRIERARSRFAPDRVVARWISPTSEKSDR